MYVGCGETLLFSFFLICSYVVIDGVFVHVCEWVRKRESGREKVRAGERERGNAGCRQGILKSGVPCQTPRLYARILCSHCRFKHRGSTTTD